MEVLDDRTLRVTITDPFPYFLAKLTYPTSFVVDRANVESGEDWTDAPNGTGRIQVEGVAEGPTDGPRAQRRLV